MLYNVFVVVVMEFVEVSGFQALWLNRIYNFPIFLWLPSIITTVPIFPGSRLSGVQFITSCHAVGDKPNTNLLQLILW